MQQGFFKYGRVFDGVWATNNTLWINKTQKKTLVRSIGALRKDIANIVKLKPYIFLEDATKLTTMVDRQQKKD